MWHAVLKLIHVLAVVLWVGGMVFAHHFLRLVAMALPPAQRLPLMYGVLRRFFAAVAVAVVLVLASGVAMMAGVAGAARRAGADPALPLDWHLMAALGTVMVVIFGFIRLRWFPRLACAVAAQDWSAGGAALAAIRRWVGVNLVLGVAIIVLALLI
jgi:uncharacterized membrane protein